MVELGLLVVLAFLGAILCLLARAAGLDPARVLLAIVLPLARIGRYRSRWLEAVELLTAAGEENANLRAGIDARDAELYRTAHAMSGARKTIEQLREQLGAQEEQIAELCVDIAVLEGHHGDELLARSEEVAVALAAAAGHADAQRRVRMDAAYEQAKAKALRLAEGPPPRRESRSQEMLRALLKGS